MIFKVIMLVFIKISLCQERDFVYYNYDDVRVVGEKCTIKPSGLEGTCKSIDECEAAKEGIKSDSYPQICHFNGNNPIVCCPGRDPGKVKKLAQEKCEDYATRKQKWYGLIGGVPSLAREFKHMAALGYGDEANVTWLCGGALISDEHVLTAAHCTYSRGFGPVKWVRLGDLNLTSTTDDAVPQNFGVTDIIRHPQYNASSKYNDIAILKLNKTIDFTPYVRPACVSTNPIPDIGKELEATGWGATSYGGEGSDHLLKVLLSVYSYDTCESFFPSERTLRNGINRDSQFCAGGINEEKDTCQGDSGGPLQKKHQDVNHTNYIEIIGITSFGRSCGVINVPGVYTKVSYYLPWIASVVWP